MEDKTYTATWFCSKCMAFKKHKYLGMISEDTAEGECVCGKITLQVFNTKPRNPIFGTGEIEIIPSD